MPYYGNTDFFSKHELTPGIFFKTIILKYYYSADFPDIYNVTKSKFQLV